MNFHFFGYEVTRRTNKKKRHTESVWPCTELITQRSKILSQPSNYAGNTALRETVLQYLHIIAWCFNTCTFLLGSPEFRGTIFSGKLTRILVRPLKVQYVE